MSQPVFATYDAAGAFRCCLMSIPVDDNNRVLAGTEGEHRPCKHCKDPESGVRFVGGVWRAAWIKDKDSK